MASAMGLLQTATGGLMWLVLLAVAVLGLAMLRPHPMAAPTIGDPTGAGPMIYAAASTEAAVQTLE